MCFLLFTAIIFDLVSVVCARFILVGAEKKSGGIKFCPWGRTDKRGGVENLIIPRERGRNV